MTAIAFDLSEILIDGVPAMIAAAIRIAGYHTAAPVMFAFIFIFHNVFPLYFQCFDTLSSGGGDIYIDLFFGAAFQYAAVVDNSNYQTHYDY